MEGSFEKYGSTTGGGIEKYLDIREHRPFINVVNANARSRSPYADMGYAYTLVTMP